jgi:hypothetical protein
MSYDSQTIVYQAAPVVRFEPTFASLRLALRTTAISAGVVRHARFITAVLTHVDVSAERGGTATADSPERLQLLVAEVGLIAFQESVALPTEDVGHLEDGLGHGFCGRRKTRRLSSTLDRVRSSSGLLTICRWRWDK